MGATEADYQWWREARFGVFIHWNMSSLLDLGGGSWYRHGNDQNLGSNVTTPGVIPAAITDGSMEQYRGQKGVPQEIYDNLYQIFNPEHFDAAEWVQVFKDAGAGYVVLTTKHHDGFCMFDSAHTDYDIMNTPFGRDIAKELADACHEAGLEVIWYYSKADWYDPRYDVAKPQPYIDYMNAQVEELCTNYGDIKGFWWDGGKLDVPGQETTDIIYRHQPGAIYNGRGPKGMPGLSFGTPEQKLGTFNMERPWETCAIMQGEGWFWNGGLNVKSAHTCLRLLIDSSIGDGNLLLDIGGRPDGKLHQPFVDNFTAIGEWTKAYGESIFGCRGGPYMPGSWGGSTRNGNHVYLHVTQQWPGGVLELPPLPATVVTASALGGGGVDIEQSADGLRIRLDASHHLPTDTIIKLELDREALSLAPIATDLALPVSIGATASASSQMGTSHRGGPGSVTLIAEEVGAETGKHFGEEGGSSTGAHKFKPSKAQLAERPWLKLHRGHVWRFWMAKATDAQPWLELDLGAATTISRMSLVEKFGRIRSHQLQVLVADEWRTVHSGGELGIESIKLAEPVTTQRVRLLITDWASDVANEGPAIHAFDIHAN
jgi:alpha-L-fucosidase